jgi:hypothetical protein
VAQRHATNVTTAASCWAGGAVAVAALAGSTTRSLATNDRNHKHTILPVTTPNTRSSWCLEYRMGGGLGGPFAFSRWGYIVAGPGGGYVTAVVLQWCSNCSGARDRPQRGQCALARTLGSIRKSCEQQNTRGWHHWCSSTADGAGSGECTRSWPPATPQAVGLRPVGYYALSYFGL